MKHFFSVPGSVSPLKICAAVIVIASLALVLFHAIPVGNRTRHLLSQIHDMNVLGLGLEGDLQSELGEGRGQFLRILLSSGEGGELDGEIATVRLKDKEIGLLRGKIVELGASPEQWRQFEDTWERYKSKRDAEIALVVQGKRAEALEADNATGRGAYQEVKESVKRARSAFELASNDRIEQAKKLLRETAVEVLLLLASTILFLLLLLWMAGQRIKTELRLAKATNELRASEDRFRQAYESATVGMGMFSLEGRVLSANRSAAEILGYGMEELVGMSVSDFMAPECLDDHRERIATLPQSGDRAYSTERRVIRKDGTSAWVRNSVTLLKAEGQEGQYFSISEEITAEKLAKERLLYLAKFDPITNLPNLYAFEEHLAQTLKDFGAELGGVALIYLEIDSFDFVKGTFGRTVANEILAEVGAELAASRRDGEFLARLDEHVFCCTVPTFCNDAEVLSRATELGKVVHRAGESGKHGIPLAASIGIASSDESATSVREGAGRSRIRDSGELLKFARAAMLEARSRGGDSIFFADRDLERRAIQRRQIEAALLYGLKENEFQVVFQPLFQIGTGRLTRFEALCRWKSQELGTIPPDRFIPIAEQTGLISEIGRRVMEIAIRQAKSWSDSGRRIGISVNVSPMQFMRPDFPQTIRDLLAHSEFPPSLLELEITEGIFIRDLNLAIARMRELHRLGVSIALDDFGTGYSSLSYLQRMPVDAVKLDRSFVREITSDSATVSMVRSVLAMAHALSLRVVTEGVETELQLDILRRLGCDEAQGYLLGRPESPEAALERVMASPLHQLTSIA